MTQPSDQGSARHASPNRPASYTRAVNNLSFSSDRQLELSPKSQWTDSSGQVPLETPADEKDDVFLPFSAASSPYQVTFPSTSPFRPSFEPLAQERQEHSRRHSRIHSRNLSVFFPRPGDAPIPAITEADEGDQQEMPVADTPNWGRDSGRSSLSNSQTANTRKGHHHRHSLSHNFFSFMDPLQTDHLSPISASSSNTTPITPDAPKAVASSLSLASSAGLSASLPMSATALSLRQKYSHLPTLIRFVLAITFHLPFVTQCALALAMAEIVLGSTLWIYGQSGESLAVTGLGYLVVFDGLGALSSITVEGNARDIDLLWDMAGPKTWSRMGERGVRYPFGTYRLTTLSHFSQCIFLLFSAVYVCKESIEHVLLLHEPHDERTASDGAASHGSAHGSFGHGELRGAFPQEQTLADPTQWIEAGVVMPTLFLTLAAVLCLSTAVFLQNHVTLTEAVGSTTYALRPRHVGLRSAKPTLWTSFLDVLSNPFTLLVLTFSVALAVASTVVPGVQLAPLDKVLALLQSVAMFYVAYPAAEATGKVLLQTAPPSRAGNMAMLRQGLRDVGNHPLTVSIPPPHVWQLTPHPRSETNLKASTKVGKASRSTGAASVIVASVQVFVKSTASDRDVLEMTSYVRDRCGHALQGGNGFPAGELTVMVSKEEIHPQFAQQHAGASRPLEATATHVSSPVHSHGHSHSSSHSHSHSHSSH